jgi:hypothetical protein
MTWNRGIYLKMACEPHFLTSIDKPLRGIVLIPFDSITVVHRELVVEIVVAFPDGDECGGKVVARRMLVVEWRFAKPMCKRVDAESGLEQANKPMLAMRFWT